MRRFLSATCTSIKVCNQCRFLRTNICFPTCYQQFQHEVTEHIPLSHSQIFRPKATIDGNVTQLEINSKPGSVAAIRTSLKPEIVKNFVSFQKQTKTLHYESEPDYFKLQQFAEKLYLVDLNRILFTCNEVDRDLTYGGAAYDIPNYGPVVYCGVQGIVSSLTDISPRNC